MITAIVRFKLPADVDAANAAGRFHDANWHEMITERYGSPEVSYFDTPVIVDNTTGV